MKITQISVTPVPSYYPKELGKNAFSDNIGKQRLEWIVRARTDGGVEGITIANRAIRQGRVEDLLRLLKTSLLGREVDSLLQVQDGVVTGPGADVARTFRSHRWMDALAFDLYGKAHNVSAISLLGGKVRDTVPAYDTTLYFQDFLVPEKGAKQVAEEAAEARVEDLLRLLKTSLLGREVDSLLQVQNGVVTGPGADIARTFRSHRWMDALAFDLYGKAHSVSAISLLGGKVRDTVPAYDTTLYFQDFLVPEKGAKQVAEEAAEAKAAGYRALKIKTGRGGRWMMPEAGMRRDVDVVLGVREAVGEDFQIYVDANFGYDGRLDLLEDFIRETIPANIYWLEEMITHDVAGYRAMREMQAKHGSQALLVCGETDRDPISETFHHLIEDGLIDGYQPDTVGAGFLRWIEIEQALHGTKVRSIPHNFGNGTFGTFATLAFGAASKTFVSLEDERNLPHIFGPFPPFKDGAYQVQERPGLGISVDEDLFKAKYALHEWRVE